MQLFHYKDATYELDEQGCLLDPKQWTKDFAEGMARECDIPVLSNEHWDVIGYVRDDAYHLDLRCLEAKDEARFFAQLSHLKF